jgi:hypothetical protein
MNSNKLDRHKTIDLIWPCPSNGKSLLLCETVGLGAVGPGKRDRPVELRSEVIMELMREQSLCEEDVGNR